MATYKLLKNKKEVPAEASITMITVLTGRGSGADCLRAYAALSHSVAFTTGKPEDEFVVLKSTKSHPEYVPVVTAQRAAIIAGCLEVTAIEELMALVGVKVAAVQARYSKTQTVYVKDFSLGVNI